MLFTELFKGRDMCNVCGQTPCNCTHIAESADPQSRKLGRIIGHIYNEIYDMGDDALDYLNDRAAVWAQLWDRYEGDIDSIIAEEDPVTLGKAALELKDILNDLQSNQDVAEGSEFGAYYYEQLAKQVFDTNPNLQDENEILNLGYNIAKGELGSRAQGMFRDEDFPSDFVSAYGYLKKQGVAEEKVRLDPKCWKGKKIGNPKTKMKGGVRVNNCVPAESVEESLADDFLKMAQGMGYKNARIAGTPAQERERTQQMMAQRAKDRENQPGPAPVSDEERTRLELQLKDLESKFDPDYEYSDDHSFWTKQRDLARNIASIKQRLAVKETEDYNKLDGQEELSNEGKTAKSEQPEADYGDDYQQMVLRLKKLAGAGPLKTVYDPNKRVYRNMPTAVQPPKN